jgi:hypothetical protein
MADRYLATCVECGQGVLTAERFADPEVASLRRHLETHHPDIATIPGTAGVLEHYMVSKEG